MGSKTPSDKKKKEKKKRNYKAQFNNPAVLKKLTPPTWIIHGEHKQHTGVTNYRRGKKNLIFKLMPSEFQTAHDKRNWLITFPGSQQNKMDDKPYKLQQLISCW